MENINIVFSDNLKRLREQKKLSLDAVAKLSGVSKSMLGQIERGDVNPTISIVWKIANGLKISFTELMLRPENDYEVIEKTSVHPLLENDGKFRNYPMFSFDSKRRFETYYIELDTGGYLEAEAHPQGTQEFITAFSGNLVVIVDEQELTIDCGSSVRFKADRPHVYKNTGNDICLLSMVIYYPE
ncbi:XRE family transcriptional regulator [Desulfosporosinus sp. FKA]|uniref:helix-turn-helix domain-containing protein n=1 Tax=Desulfosporosinus sp. FKA TaxID=1969834 RepID=UPI000B4A032C|nr:XRE family transcriptional regulator [Desulfosporosinus sp. FKA]